MRADFQSKYSFIAFTLSLLFREISSEPTYFYYDITGDNLIIMEDDGTVPQDLWQPDSEVKVLVHGWNPFAGDALKNQHMITLARAFGDFDPLLNIIIVDWTYRANTSPTQYNLAVDGAMAAAGEIAEFLIQLVDEGNIDDFSMVHCLGHSLGAHVCGVVGYEIQQMNGGEMIGRITGLDPAGPSFTTGNGNWPKDLTRVLDYSDAEFVDIIHTNVGSGKIGLVLLLARLGSNLKAGHVDFYPNGGVEQKYYCGFFADRFDACSHKIAVLYYALSLRDPTALVACPCENYNKFVSGYCPCSLGDTGIPLGEMASLATRQEKRMKYYLKIRTPI